MRKMEKSVRQKYPVGMQSFPEIQERGFVYVDKSGYIPLLHEFGKYFFLGRPRRFGKSLLLSMLHAYYEGCKDLFKGLAVMDYETKWEPQPVLHLDFTGVVYDNETSLNSALMSMMALWEKKYDVKISDDNLGIRFGNLIRAASEFTGKKVVILIDEYDKPLLDTVNQPEIQDKFRNILRGVYGNLKKMDSFIQFAMLTGVSRFGKLSIFSDINNLKDISMMQEFSGICGITSDELHQYFNSGIETYAKSQSISVTQAYAELKANYDGYHFTEKCFPDVYNPFSLLNALQDQTIDDYWFESGTPKHLIDIISERHISLTELENVEESKSKIKNVSFSLDSTLVPMLYQSGYLTIKGYDPDTQMLRLGYPNKEVRKGFLLYLMERYTQGPDLKTWTDIVKFYNEIRDGKIDDFMHRLKSMYADFNRDSFKFVNIEQHYQDVAYLVFRLLGCLTSVEYKTATGRIDMVVKMPDYIYVFEFKRNGSPQQAMEQINSKDYLLPFQTDGRKVIKIGANFNDKIKGLENWIVEQTFRPVP